VVSKGYKFRFYPNSAQKKQLAQDFGCARHVWNHALERRTRAYQEHGERLTGVDISREITELKHGERPWLGEANSTVLTQVLRDQDHNPHA
jgi:putative transposase